MSVLAFLLAWHLIVRVVGASAHRFPSPVDVLIAAKEMAQSGLLASDLTATLARVLMGFATGILLGILAGVLTGSLASARLVLQPLIQIARPIPAVAMIPLAMAWFGIGDLPKIFIVAWASFFPTWVNTHSGIARTPLEFEWTAHVLGASGWRSTLYVAVPWSLPFVFAGVRTALGLAFAATVVAEMSGASAGIGYRILESHWIFRIDRMLASILIIGFLGATSDLVLRRVVHWRLPWIKSRGDTP